MEKNSILLVDTGYIPTYEEYEDYCRENGENPGKEYSSEYWDFVNMERRHEAECFWDNLRHSKTDFPVMVTGRLGLWNGSPEIRPVPFLDRILGRIPIECAVTRCVSGRDIDDYEVSLENGRLHVKARHHDGTNSFEIRRLSEYGILATLSAERRGVPCRPTERWFRKIKERDLFG